MLVKVIKNIFTESGKILAGSEINLTGEELKHFEKIKAVKRVKPKEVKK
jgi:hypothetical protein